MTRERLAPARPDRIPDRGARPVGSADGLREPDRVRAPARRLAVAGRAVDTRARPLRHRRSRQRSDRAALEGTEAARRAGAHAAAQSSIVLLDEPTAGPRSGKRARDARARSCGCATNDARSCSRRTTWTRSIASPIAWPCCDRGSSRSIRQRALRSRLFGRRVVITLSRTGSAIRADRPRRRCTRRDASTTTRCRSASTATQSIAPRHRQGAGRRGCENRVGDSGRAPTRRGVPAAAEGRQRDEADRRAGREGFRRAPAQPGHLHSGAAHRMRGDPVSVCHRASSSRQSRASGCPTRATSRSPNCSIEREPGRRRARARKAAIQAFIFQQALALLVGLTTVTGGDVRCRPQRDR